eukprot:SAG11_NODE_12086_length_722_cov_1.410915_1_plen_67_part_01
MNDAALLRCGTIFAALAEAGTPIYVATAKDKLLKLLTHGLGSQPAPSFVRHRFTASVPARQTIGYVL